MILFKKRGKEILERTFPKHHFVFHESIDSTNKDAEERIKAHFLQYIILANHQTQGRGRRGREWQSARNKNIYISLCLKNEFKSAIGGLNLFLGTALYQTIYELYGNFKNNLTLKWPNDLYIGEKKLAGLLIQTSDPKLENIIVGIGINVYADETDIPDIATSIQIQSKNSLPETARVDIISKLIENLEQEKILAISRTPHIAKEMFWEYSKKPKQSYTPTVQALISIKVF